MDWKNTILVIVLIANFALAFFSYFKSKRGKVNLIWSTVIGAVILWIASMILYRSSPQETSVIWCQILYVSATLIPISFLYFTFIYPHGEWKITKRECLLIVLPMIIVVVLVALKGMIIKDVKVHLGQEKEILWGPAYLLYTVYISSYFTWALWNLFKRYIKSHGILKSQVRYMLLGTSLSIVLGSIFNLFLPTIGDFRFNWLGQVATLFMVGFVSYAVMVYQLMDIRFVIGKSAVYFLSFLVVIGLASLTIILNNKLEQPATFNVLGPLIIFLSILLFQPVYRFFENLASKYFYYTFYSYQTVIINMGRKLTRVLDLDQLASLITSTLVETMKLDRTVILLRDPQTGDYQIKKNIGFREENGISLVRDDFLTSYLEKTKRALVYEELSLVIRDSKMTEKTDLEKLKQNMKRIEASLCLPLLIEDKIIGIIVLGNKISGDSYSKEDLDLLTALSHQASIALQNAKLYSQVQDLSKNLQAKVDEQTRELKEAYEELKKLDEAKSEFISIASHQLRTPLSIIKGYLSMAVEGTYGNMPGRMKEPIQRVFQTNERLIKLVGDILTVSRIEAGRIELNLEKSSLKELITSVIEALKTEAKGKNLVLAYKEEKEPLPQILMDKEKIRQVLIIIIDNAILYTQKGNITVEASQSRGLSQKVVIEIKDTGAGISKKDLKDLFKSFSRGHAGDRYWTEGAGLGLYIAQKFVKLHGGDIRAESAGKNKGTSFYIDLPMAADKNEIGNLILSKTSRDR
ncbi:MAG: ATP-binding protein [bacterium]|nr:ATP-binding protein [bacterium]